MLESLRRLIPRNPARLEREAAPKEERFSHADEYRRVRGPSALLWGWIPRFRFPYRDMPPNEYASHPDLTLREVAFRALFLSGNAEPRPTYQDGMRSLEDHVETKEFRGLIGLEWVELVLDRSNAPVLVRYNPFHSVGFTPKPFRKIRGYSRGKPGGTQFVAVSDGNAAIVTCVTHFKLGRGYDRVSRWMTGHWAPFVALKLNYRIDAFRAEVAYDGTWIPSQLPYHSWHACIGPHDMVTISGDRIDGFVNCGTTLGLWHESDSTVTAEIRNLPMACSHPTTDLGFVT